MPSVTPPPSSDSNVHSDYKVAVIGGGLVGLVLSTVLCKSGYSVDCFDADVVLKEIGAGIIIPVNGCRALAEIGVMNEIRARSSVVHNWMMHSWSEGANASSATQPLGDFVMEPDMRQKYGEQCLVIHRADLRRVLHDAAVAEGVRVHMASQIDVARTDFARGHLYRRRGRSGDDADADTPVFRADLVIACDGQASAARSLLSGKSGNPRYTGKTVHRLLIDAARMRELGLESLLDPPCIHMWMGPQRLAVGYLLKDVFNCSLTIEDNGDEAVVGPSAIDAESLQAAYGPGWDPRIRKLAENGHGFHKWQILDYSSNEPESWVRYNPEVGDNIPMVLCGDAAHAMGPFIGIGAAIGFESAVLLGNLLAHAPSRADIPRALKMYEELRKPRTLRARGVTAKMGRVWMVPDGEVQEERDETFINESKIPLAGYPNVMQDPFFQQWLCGYNARQEAVQAWERERAGKKVSTEANEPTFANL